MKINVLPNQIAIVSKKNGLQKLLMDGTHHVFCSNVKLLNRKNSLESVNLDATILTSGNVKEKFTSFEVKNNEIGFHYIDGIFSDYLSAGKYTFAKEPYEHKLIIKNMSNVKIGDDIEISILRNAITSQPNNILNATIVEGYTGALYIDGALKELLPPGEYYFFQGVKKVFVKPISLKKQTLTINGQEILSKDKVTLRFNLILNYQIKDASIPLKNYDDFEEELRLLVQMKYREYLGEKTLDEILAEKESMGAIVLSELKKEEHKFGAEFINSGIKDLILPGDIREILNTVLIAEKKAMANVITRREETASTRSLLNTAKLMEENETLFRLKEFEYLERIFDKVQSLSLTSSSSAIEQLSSLLHKSDKK